MAVEEVGPLSYSIICSLTCSFSLQEFAIEIPDAEADEIKTVQQGMQRAGPTLLDLTIFLTAIDYIAKTPEGN